MTERATPYVGISGVVNPEQQETLAAAFEASGLRTYGRQLMLGVKAVHKTQWLDIGNKYGREWFPVGPEEFGSALDRKRDTFNVAQMFYEPDMTHDPAYREAFLRRIADRAEWLDGVQFDMLPWHDEERTLDVLAIVKSIGKKVLLQCHGDTMNALGPNGTIQRLAPYAPSIDYLLFDSSHGKGVEMNPDALLPFVDAAYESSGFEHVGVGIAGGLSAQTVENLLPAVAREFPGISIDTEGKVHPVQSDGTRPVSLQESHRYFDAFAGVLEKVY